MVQEPDPYYLDHFNKEDRMIGDNGCRYVGRLAIEKDACVAMTGCFGSEDVEFTIMSRHAEGSNAFVWTKEGEIHAIKTDNEVNDNS